MRFSIVTPSYNQGEFLAATIESVITQSGDFLLDYIVMDGGSTDASVAIIRRYEEMLQQGEVPIACRGITFRWTSAKDAGQSDAILKGFDMATGEIFAWLNSDDTYLPGALQAAADHFRMNSDTALLYGGAHYCDAAGTAIGRYRTGEFDLAKLAYANFICQPAAFFRSSAFRAVGGLDRTLHFAMDYDLWIRIGKRFSCRYLPRILATYRLHETSKTIRDQTLYENSEEALRLAIGHFGWAPLTRVYNSCNFYCRAQLPRLLAGNKPALLLATLLCSVLRSLRLNRGICSKDLALFNRENFRKLFKSRIEIMTGNDGTGSGSDH